ncbi:helix-turn-helix domain-containing protein [Furfurilactobacillus entadae]|uniref:helix-turn-helix domain-containing protein n=1 Tax=Furfurilactobacillus entadae TaxID=2922307 RepID=UPI0035EF60C3
MVRVDLDNTEIMSAGEAAEIWGKNAAYVRNSLRQSPDKWPKGTYRVFGKQIVVTAEGMEAATGEPDPRKTKA